MKRVVVLGTGTNVGKTYVAVALALALARRGTPVQALKPVESGGDTTGFGDAKALAKASFGTEPEPRPLFGFAAPLSPHLAARQDGLVLPIEQVVRWVEERSRGSGWCIIETAGGVLTPLTNGATNFDLARALDPSLWLLVAPDGLGVLNAMATTQIALGALNRTPDLYALSAPPVPDASTGTNAAELRLLGICAAAAVFPNQASADPVVADELADAVIRLSGDD